MTGFLMVLLAQSPVSQIAYASRRDGNWDIYRADANGRAEIRLSTGTEPDRFPVWSPDRTKIAFGTEREGKWELHLMNADGSRPRLLTRDVIAKGPRRWSPDGTRILFETERDGNRDRGIIGDAGRWGAGKR